MQPREEAIIPVAAHWIRPIGLGVLVIFLLFSALLVWMGRELLFNYGQLWRQAPIVETVYPMFSMPASIPLALMILLFGLHALLTGRALGSESGLWLRSVLLLGRIMLLLLIFLTPALAIGTTIALKMLDYRTCSELRVSGSAWQVFWVNNDAYCFVPDRFINGNWPCRIEGSKTLCLQADGR